jgi:hypothetical protein
VFVFKLDRGGPDGIPGDGVRMRSRPGHAISRERPRRLSRKSLGVTAPPVSRKILCRTFHSGRRSSFMYRCSACRLMPNRAANSDAVIPLFFSDKNSDSFMGASIVTKLVTAQVLSSPHWDLSPLR